MNMKRPLLAMLAAAILFAVYLWDTDRTEKALLRDLQEQQVFYQNPADAIALEFDVDGSKVRVERGADGKWSITEPKKLPADSGAVDAYLENLRGARRHAEFAPESLEKYGLAKPKLRVTLTTKEGPRTLEFGDQPSDMGRVYAHLADEKSVFTVSEWIFRQSRRDIDVLRDKSLARTDPARAKKIRIENTREQFTVERAGDTSEKWSVRTDADLPVPADRVLMDRFMATFAKGMLLAIADNPTSTTAMLGLDSPAAKIFADDKLLLEVGGRVAKKDQFFVRTEEGAIGVAPASLLADIFRSSVEWGSKHFVWYDRKDIYQIETASGNSHMLLQFDNGKWIFPDMPGVAIREDKMAEFLDNVLSFTASKLVKANADDDDAKSYGVVGEGYRVTVTSADMHTQGFRFGRTDSREGATYVLRIQDNSLWRVDLRNTSNVFRFRKDLEERRLVPGLAAKVDRFELEMNGAVIAFEKTPAAWRVTIPGLAPAVVPPSATDPFLTALEALEVDTEWANLKPMPSIVTMRFYHAQEAEPFVALSLLTRSKATRKALLSIGTRQVDVEGEPFDKFDEAMANMLMAAKLKADEAKKP